MPERGDERDLCQVVTVDGQPVRVRAPGPLTEEDVEHLGEVIRAAQVVFAARPVTRRHYMINSLVESGVRRLDAVRQFDVLAAAHPEWDLAETKTYDEWALQGIPSELTAGVSTCPICQLTWTVTILRDCLLPACGCYGSDTSPGNPYRPCHDCGLDHALSCPKKPA